MIEVWKDIPGYDGKYQASREGQIRRVYRSGKTRIMSQYKKPCISGSDRLHVKLSIDGKGKEVIVQQAVASTFLGPCPEGCVAYHINGSQYDNNINNLKYISKRELGKLTGSKSRRKSVFKIDANGEVVDVYSSAREAGRKNYLNHQTVTDRCNGKWKSAFAPDGYAYAWEDSAISIRHALQKIEKEKNRERQRN